MVVDFLGAPRDISLKIARSLKNIRNLTSIVGLGQQPETVEALLLGIPNLVSVDHIISDRKASLCNHLQISQTITFYESVLVTDDYRTGYPYILFPNPAKSKCIIAFHPPEKTAISLKLNHCRTTALAEIVIMVNEIDIHYDSSLTPRDNFGFTTVPISSEFVTEGINELVIVLKATSPGRYWLSDISLDME
jgi:hypothetical protein